MLEHAGPAGSSNKLDGKLAGRKPFESLKLWQVQKRVWLFQRLCSTLPLCLGIPEEG